MSTLSPQSELQQLLQSLRRRWQRWLILRTCLQSLCILLAGLGLLWVADTFYFLSPSVRNISFLLIMATCGIWLVQRLLNLQHHSPTDSQLAALIEEKHPELDELLLAAVDYQQSESTHSRLEQQLQQSLIRKAVGKLQHIDIRPLLRPIRTLRVGISCLLLLMGILLFLAIFSYRTAPWHRVLAPWSTPAPNHTIQVEAGAQLVYVGDSLSLTAKLLEESAHAPQLDLQLNWQSVDSPVHTLPLIFDSETKSFPIQWDNIDSSREYWITSRNSFDSSPRYELEVVSACTRIGFNDHYSSQLHSA
ncbi:MAG: hypothetical protein R3C11_17595 [Planctomycetaceae bacterium]